MVDICYEGVRIVVSERLDESLHSSLAGLAGGAAGAGAGLLMVNPMNVASRVKEEKQAEQAVQDFRRSREVLHTLNDLYTGNLSWDEVTEEAKPYLEDLYEANQEFLKDRHGVQQQLKEKGPGDLIRMEGTPRFRPKELLPNKSLLADVAETFKHPAVRVGGMLGGLGGYLGYETYQDMKAKEQAEE